MAEFGWAYVAGGAITGALGPTGSIQVKETGTDIRGYSDLLWNNTTKTIELNGNISSSVNISASFFYGDGSNLTSVGSDLIVKEEGSNITTAATSINFVGATVTASVSGTDVTVTVNNGSGGGGTIGAAEDGSYTDGLFTDFTTNTLIGVPIDRFNEVLKILAPSPAPALSRVNSDNSAGSTVKLSFGAGGAVAGYTSSNTTAGFSAVDVNGTYQNETSGSNFRLGAYKNNTDITGFLNFHVVQSVQNGYLAYSNDAFGNAETGSLKLELNGNVVHTVNLASFVGSGNPFTGSANSLTGDSGFTNVSVTASSFDGNNSEWHIFKHRTAKIKVDVNDMVPGWNYVRAIHTIGATDYATNYVEWINDPSGSINDLSVANGRIEDIVLVGSKYLSGVQYNTDATAKYKVDINNLYRNIYAASGTPISFTTTNSTTPASQAVPAIGGGENNTKILGVTASLDCNTNSLLSGAITANVTVTHPFKSTISTTGSATTGNGFLIDNRTLASTNVSEKFHDESFRKTSGSYANQSAVVAAASMWNSQNHMTGGGAAGHTDGLIFFNQALYSPVDGDIPNGGNFSGIANVSSGQPNYSSVTGTRTFYRVLSNSSGADLFNFKIESTKNGTTYNNSSLGTSNVHFFAKIPGTTGWMDISQAFVYGSVGDGDGALISAVSDSDTHVVTFGTASVANGSHIMLKVLADESWQGYISQLDFTLPANQSQATPNVLNNIANVQTDGESANLSFGSSNNVPGYFNVLGGGLVGGTPGMNIDVNETFFRSGGDRGVFATPTVISGTLNSGGGGSGFPVDVFFNGYSGSLVLEVNGTDVHTVVLSGTLNAISNNFNGDGSGFDLSAVSFSTVSSIPHYAKPYRSGTYHVGTGSQRTGWNHARVKHGSNATNYIQWVVDPSGAVDNTALSTAILSDFGHTSKYYQSGIGYFAAMPTASFTYSGSNFYNNVYDDSSNNSITFPTTDNCSITNVRSSGTGLTTKNVSSFRSGMPQLDESENCETTTIEVTGTVLFDTLTSISGGLGLFTDHDVSVNSTMLHPLKSDRTTATVSKTSFMVYSGSIGSTTLTNNEYFNTEDYRIVSGNYANQAEASSSVNAWNSQTAMNNGGSHDDGMVSVSGYAISPLQIGKAGDTRNNAQGSTGLQAPAGNPNYSSAGLTNNIRTFYRLFRYTGVSTVASFTMTLYGDATLVGKSGTYAGSLGANKNVFVELKIPFDPNFSGADDQSTLWGDAAKIASGGDPPHVADGAGLRTGETTGEDQSIDSNGLALSLTLGTRRIKQNQYYIVKISAHKDWTGYISRIQVAY